MTAPIEAARTIVTPDGLPPPMSTAAGLGALRRTVRNRRFQLGALCTGVVLGVALIGPAVAPHGSADLIGTTFGAPSSATPLGTDYLGRDVLSRVLDGGRNLVWMSIAATLLGVVAGVVLGLLAAYARGIVDWSLMAAMDVALAFPQYVLPILFISLLGPKLWLIVVLVAVTHAPRAARLARATTLEKLSREYVQACDLFAVPKWRILAYEVLPNIMTPIMVDFGIRLTWSIGIISAINFLGFGVQPPTADWGLMIEENRTGLFIQPWCIVAPVILIGLFTIGTNLVSEGYSRVIAGVGERI